MSLDKKGFAKLIQDSINECRCISEYNRSFAENVYLTFDETEDNMYKYNKYMNKLALSKIKRLYSILSLPAYSRIVSMSDSEVEEYRKDKLSEVTNSINRLMLAMEVSSNSIEQSNIKNKIEALVDEQTILKEMTSEILKKHVIDKLELENSDSKESFNGKEETEVLQNIVKDKNSLDEFLTMVNDYIKLERDIKSIRAEQIIIYNDLLKGNVKRDISIDELFDEDSLNKLQATIAEKISEISKVDSDLKIHFNNKTKNAFYKIKSNDYKFNSEGKVLPYENTIFEVFEDVVPSRIIELAKLQNDEWLRLNKKMFKTTDVNSTLSQLCIEIEDTKNIILSFVKEWYKNAYYNNSLFAPISSRLTGKFEYSLGAKNILDEFVNYGVWPDDNAISALKLCLKLNRLEAEKSIIYAEQIKERLSRLFNAVLDENKKKLEVLDNKITSRFGNWKNEVILSIVNETK